MENIVNEDQQQTIAMVAAILGFAHGIIEVLAPQKNIEMYSNEHTELRFKEASEKAHAYGITRIEGL